MFRPIPTIIRLSSESILVFIRFVQLCNDGEIPLSVVFIITNIKRCGSGGGVFCNVGIVQTGVQCWVICNGGIVLTGGAMLDVLYCGYCADRGCSVGCSVMWLLC